ncbi:hypothetical protein HUN08_00790 [Gordonia sp. X0973]|uniref:hypothetical protein n=1 Tax=Gordonia sp. X0973 TaxID=2742602 RepID=UPI000F52D6EE|nr:hypothetical protein [Gordonia sp. X0973]QKT05891.1 hypothetical protein HUN08_00790 [Gordonia sp. X0973]
MAPKTPPTTPPRAPMPAEPGVVPAPPGQPVQKSAQFGILPSQVSDIANKWKNEGDAVNGLDFSALGAAKGEGSTTFAAVRAVQGPAKKATDSIGERLKTLGTKLEAFNSRVVETDARVAADIRSVAER